MNINYAETGRALSALWRSLPDGVAALILLLAGLFLAIFVRVSTARILDTEFFNRLYARIGFSDFIRKGSVSYSPAKLIALMVYWLILLSTVLWSLHLMGVEVAGTLLDRIKVSLPGFIAAIVIVFFGYALVAFLANVVRTIARNSGSPYAGVLANVIRGLGLFMVVGLAVDQLGAEFKLISAAFIITMAAAAFGLALAFGLGCKDMARDAAQRFLQNLRDRLRPKGTDLEG